MLAVSKGQKQTIAAQDCVYHLQMRFRLEAVSASVAALDISADDPFVPVLLLGVERAHPGQHEEAGP